MNPFLEKVHLSDNYFMNWNEMYPKPYCKQETDPYTKVRIILMNGTEFEATWFSHQFHRHCDDNDLRREIAYARRIEQQQQKRLACLKPADESILETTISYEQLAVDLTAILAQREPNPYVVQTLNLALLEDFDHLYRYADLLDFEKKIHAERLVGCYTEIMPGRPTLSEHRHPFDSVRNWCDFNKSELITKLNTSIITAAEQQTMNYYMNQSGFYESELGRRLYQEIAMIEEQHVTQYGALLDTTCTWLESMLMHEYVECYLYYSCYEDETDAYIKGIWEEHFNQELMHLHKACELLKTYEKKDWQVVIPDGEFPELLKFSPQKEYIRRILRDTVENTAVREDPAVNVKTLPNDALFFKYQSVVNRDIHDVASHVVIKKEIEKLGHDYRYEDCPHPVKDLQCRTCDNICVGRR